MQTATNERRCTSTANHGSHDYLDGPNASETWHCPGFIGSYGERVTIETTAGPATGRIVSAPFTIHEADECRPVTCVAVELDRDHQGYLSACPPDHDPVTWHTLRAHSSVYVSTLVANVENLEPAPPADITPDQ